MVSLLCIIATNKFVASLKTQALYVSRLVDSCEMHTPVGMMAAGQPIGFYLSVQSTARPIAARQPAAITVLVATNPKLTLGNANAVPDRAWATGAATFSSSATMAF
jgi:hypothetical protein